MLTVLALAIVVWVAVGAVRLAHTVKALKREASAQAVELDRLNRVLDIIETQIK
jgi:cell division protein FtsB